MNEASRQRVLAAQADKEEQARRQHQSWLELPEMTHDEVLRFLQGSEPLDNTDPEHAHVVGKRLPRLGVLELYSFVTEGNFLQRRAVTGYHEFFGFAWHSRTKVWVFGRGGVERTSRGESMTNARWLAFRPDGVVVLVEASRQGLNVLDRSGASSLWHGSPTDFEAARQLLQKGAEAIFIPTGQR